MALRPGIRSEEAVDEAQDPQKQVVLLGFDGAGAIPRAPGAGHLGCVALCVRGCPVTR